MWRKHLFVVPVKKRKRKICDDIFARGFKPLHSVITEGGGKCKSIILPRPRQYSALQP